MGKHPNNKNALFDFFFSKKFEEQFENALDHVLNEQKDSLESYIKELAEHYTAVINEIAPTCHKVTIDPENIRMLRIDGKAYDLDFCISHRQSELYEHLSAIDALFADVLSMGIDLATCCRKVENHLC